jgi:hypothetical protein
MEAVRRGHLWLWQLDLFIRKRMASLRRGYFVVDPGHRTESAHLGDHDEARFEFEQRKRGVFTTNRVSRASKYRAYLISCPVAYRPLTPAERPSNLIFIASRFSRPRNFGSIIRSITLGNSRAGPASSAIALRRSEARLSDSSNPWPSSQPKIARSRPG